MNREGDGQGRRVLVAHNVQRGGWGGMARLMEAAHGALEAFGWTTRRKRTPAARWGEIDDFAGIAVFLASPASDFVTGTAIPVDGGFSIMS